MRKPTNKAMLIVMLVTCFLVSACAEVKQAGRTVGHTTRDVAKEIGHGTRDAAQDIGRGTKRVVTQATKDDEQKP
jgi:predicted small secreted protein